VLYNLRNIHHRTLANYALKRKCIYSVLDHEFAQDGNKVSWVNFWVSKPNGIGNMVSDPKDLQMIEFRI